jgi:hypothetical protein
MKDTFPKYILLAIGILVASSHLWLGLKAIFVFRNNEPLSTWIFVLLGPLSTLPAVVVGFFWPKIGGTWLIIGSILSFFLGQLEYNSQVACSTLYTTSSATVLRCWCKVSPYSL